MPKFRHAIRPVPIARLERGRTQGQFGPQYAHDPVVYYMRFAGLVKIGTTRKIASRIRNIPNDGLLAVELGSRQREQARHVQFGHLRRTGEWFDFDPELAGHVVDLREQWVFETDQTVEQWLERQLSRRR